MSHFLVTITEGQVFLTGVWKFMFTTNMPVENVTASTHYIMESVKMFLMEAAY